MRPAAILNPELKSYFGFASFRRNQEEIVRDDERKQVRRPLDFAYRDTFRPMISAEGSRTARFRFASSSTDVCLRADPISGDCTSVVLPVCPAPTRTTTGTSFSSCPSRAPWRQERKACISATKWRIAFNPFPSLFRRTRGVRLTASRMFCFAPDIPIGAISLDFQRGFAGLRSQWIRFFRKLSRNRPGGRQLIGGAPPVRIGRLYARASTKEGRVHVRNDPRPAYGMISRMRRLNSSCPVEFRWSPSDIRTSLLSASMALARSATLSPLREASWRRPQLVAPMRSLS